MPYIDKYPYKICKQYVQGIRFLDLGPCTKHLDIVNKTRLVKCPWLRF